MKHASTPDDIDINVQRYRYHQPTAYAVHSTYTSDSFHLATVCGAC